MRTYASRTEYALLILAAVVLIGFVGLLFKLRADARSAPFSGPSAGDVSKAWQQRWADFDKLMRGQLHDVGCDATAGTTAFSCQISLSAAGSHGVRETFVVRPTSYCTGTKRCMVVDNTYFKIGAANDTGDISLVSLFAGLD